MFKNFLKKDDEPKEFILKGYGKEAKENLTELFVKYLQPFWHEDNYMPGLVLYLQHPDAQQIFLITDNLEFRDKYLLKACKEKSINVDEQFKWEVKIEQPQNSEAKEIRKGIFLQIIEHKKGKKTVTNDLPTIPTLAKITPLKGNLVKKVHKLYANKLYNIGRGQKPELPNGMFHENQIVVVDDDLKSVSRKHACIFFDPQEGFCLKAYEGGSSFLSNNSTILYRDGKITEVHTKKPEPLQHGDQIKLGVKNKDSVVLLFEFEEEKKKKLVQEKGKKS